MRFRRPYKKPADPLPPAGRSAPVRGADVTSALGNRAVERDVKSAGEPLPASTRAQMEAAMGASFKDVRLHTDPEATQQARQAGASAFTHGKDIVFDREQYQPGTPGGDTLIAHELAHVVQQRGATTEGHNSTALEMDAAKAAVRATGFFGALKARLAGAAPVLQSGLAIQRCDCGGSKKAPKKGGGTKSRAQDKPAKKPAKGTKADAKDAPADPLAAEKQAIATAYGLSRVADGDVKWTAAELAKMKRTLAKIPADAKAAIQGVALIRVGTPNCPGGDPAGCFRQSVNATTGDREDVIEIGTTAFDQDKDMEDKSSGVKVTRTDASGATITSLPSEDVLLHEVGHAVDSAKERQAVAARFRADLAVTPVHDKLNTAVKALTTPGVAGISNASASELAYHRALVAVTKTLSDVRDKADELPDEPSVKKLKSTSKEIKDAKPGVQKAIKARNDAKAKLPKGSTAAQTDVEAAQDKSFAAIDGVLKALEERIEAQKKLDDATAAEEATKAKVPGTKDKVETSRQLAEVVAIVRLKKIDVKNNAALRQYPKDHWPDDPDELYADLFQMSISEPGGLKTFDPDIAEYFKQPIGVKDAALKKKVDAWIEKQKK